MRLVVEDGVHGQVGAVLAALAGHAWCCCLIVPWIALVAPVSLLELYVLVVLCLVLAAAAVDEDDEADHEDEDEAD